MIDLAVPGLSTVAVPESADAGRARFRALLEEWLPDLTPARLDLLSEGITAFRERLAAGGWIYHGVAGGPAGRPFDVPTSWHYLAAVAPALPDVEPETLLAHALGWSHLPKVTPAATTPAMGRGIGFHADVRTGSVLREVPLDTPDEADSVGLAAYLSIDDERRRALLVVGISLLPGTTTAMAVLAREMAAHSTFRADALPRT